MMMGDMVHSNGGGLSQSSTFWEWKSPLPYIFISLGLAFSIILVAIIILACSLHKQSSSGGGGDGDEKSGSTTVNRSAEMSPSFIVVMAGDAKPTHIAIPVPPSFINKEPS